MSLTVNYLAVVVAAAVSFVLGMIWHGPLFGKTWAAARGITPEQMEKGRKEMPRFMALIAVSLLVTAWGLAVLSGYLHLATWLQGLKLGLLCWFGFSLTAVAAESMMTAGRRMPQFLISAGSWLITCAASGIIVAVWR